VVPLPASLPSWVDVDFLRTAAGVMALVAIVAVLVAVFLIRSIGTRVLVFVVLGATVAGLLHYRQTLVDCDKQGCACTLFGEEVRGGGCRSSTR
jgi:hypothetical protein